MSDAPAAITTGWSEDDGELIWSLTRLVDPADLRRFLNPGFQFLNEVKDATVHLLFDGAMRQHIPGDSPADARDLSEILCHRLFSVQGESSVSNVEALCSALILRIYARHQMYPHGLCQFTAILIRWAIQRDQDLQLTTYRFFHILTNRAVNAPEFLVPLFALAASTVLAWQVIREISGVTVELSRTRGILLPVPVGHFILDESGDSSEEWRTLWRDASLHLRKVMRDASEAAFGFREAKAP